VSNDPHRFEPLDGLRAVAAGFVALYHFQQRIPDLDAVLPRFVSRALQHGNVGVEIFFVLSGFAVARSLCSTTFGARALGRFMLRRTVRLDPPYAFVVLVTVVLALSRPSSWPVRPTPSLVAAHLLYLQGILGLPHLQGVFWTLCIEIQLYFSFALLFAIAQRARLVDGEGHRFGALLFATALSASMFALDPFDSVRNVYFVPWWPLFCLGVLTERALRIRSARFWLFVTVVALSSISAWRTQLTSMVGLATVATMCLAAAIAPVGRIFASRPLVALGRLSYSFYLLHALVGGMVFSLAMTRLPHSPLGDVARVVLAALVALGASWLLWRCVEGPSQRWARRIRLGGAKKTPRTNEPVPAHS